MSGIRTIIGSLSALMIIFGNSPVTIATAQDQPIKRTELHRSDLADVVGKERPSAVCCHPGCGCRRLLRLMERNERQAEQAISRRLRWWIKPRRTGSGWGPSKI